MLKNSVRIIIVLSLLAGNSFIKKSEPFNEFSHHWPDNAPYDFTIRK